MKTTFRSLFACAAAGALAVSLVACGSEEAQQTTSQVALADGLAPGWSMMDLAGVDPEFYGEATGPLPRALPMAASYDGGDYGYAPMYDYAPADTDSNYQPLDDSYYYDDGYDDGGYYDEPHDAGEPYDNGSGDGGLLGLGGDGSALGLLAVAAALSGVLGDAPPDYGFAYDGVSPWAWETGDRYYRYAEPVSGGYRYYYYEPDAYRPFFVSDPYYSYGYRNDRVVGVYDRGGRRIDASRARMQLQAAKAYYARAERLHRAAQRDRHGVPAPLWERHRDTISRDRNDWIGKAYKRPAVQQWEARHAPKVQKRWAGEALVRRDAERKFANWQRADYTTPAPKFYTPQVKQEQVRRIADLRQERAKEIADRRRERTEKQREVRHEAQRLAQRTERAASRDPQQQARQLAADRARAGESRAAARPENRATQRVAERQESARAVVAARREDRKAQQTQRLANRAVNERKTDVKATREAAQAKPAPRQSVDRPAAKAERSRVERQQEVQQRQKAQQEARAERARQTAAKQQERSARQEQAKANTERQERAARQASANSAREAANERRAERQVEQRQRAQAMERQQAQSSQRERAQADAQQRQAQAQQRQQAQTAERERAQAERQAQAQAAQRERAQSEQRQAQAQQRQAQTQQVRTEQRQEARQERQNAREERRNQRRGDRG